MEQEQEARRATQHGDTRATCMPSDLAHAFVLCLDSSPVVCSPCRALTGGCAVVVCTMHELDDLCIRQGEKAPLHESEHATQRAPAAHTMSLCWCHVVRCVDVSVSVSVSASVCVRVLDT